MDFNSDQNQAFFDKLHSSNNTRNLSQIFEDDNKQLQSESKCLRYQPQTSHELFEPQQQSQQNETWKTVIAVVADGFNSSKFIGSVGLALLRNESGAAQLIVYKNKGNILSCLLLTKSKTSSSPRVDRCTVIKREMYLQFFDEEVKFWSIHIHKSEDETKFVKELTNIGLNLNERPFEARTAEKASEATPVKSNTKESISDSTFSGEDVIATNTERKSPLTMVKTLSTVSLIDKPQENASHNKLEAYLEDQRATGQSIENKMDLILQALSCLATNYTGSMAHLKEGGDCTIDGLKQANIKPLHQCNDNEETSTMYSKKSINDDEDELIELEQKMLDYKKQNRALLKSLNSRDKAIDELREKTAKLCNELITENNDLKERNSSLIAAMNAMKPVENRCNCEHYQSKIVKLERRIYQLYADLIELKVNDEPVPNRN